MLRQGELNSKDLSRLLPDIINRLIPQGRISAGGGDIITMLKSLINQTCQASATQGKPQRFPLVFLIPIQPM